MANHKIIVTVELETTDGWAISYGEQEAPAEVAERVDAMVIGAVRAYFEHTPIVDVIRSTPSVAAGSDVISQAFCGSQSYAAGRMTHAIIRDQGFSGVQTEVVHDALMAAFQAGYLAAAEGVSVEDLLARMASL